MGIVIQLILFSCLFIVDLESNAKNPSFLRKQRVPRRHFVNIIAYILANSHLGAYAGMDSVSPSPCPSVEHFTGVIFCKDTESYSSEEY